MDYCEDTMPDLFRREKEIEDFDIKTEEEILELFHQLSPERQRWLTKELENHIDDAE